MEIVSYILSALSLSTSIVAPLIRGENLKKILILSFLGNFFIALSYVLSGASNGAAACFVGAGMAIINYFFSSRNKRVPKWLDGIYIAIMTGVNLFVAGGISVPSVLVMIAGVMFVLSVGQENGRKYRIWSTVNLIIWVIYDALMQTWGPFGQHLLLLGVNIVGIIVFDIKKQAVKGTH